MRGRAHAAFAVAAEAPGPLLRLVVDVDDTYVTAERDHAMEICQALKMFGRAELRETLAEINPVLNPREPA
jgi:hypothetical protein